MKQSHVIPNVDSTARDHLANERTFLAWVRTALGFIGLGLVIAKRGARGEIRHAASLGLFAEGGVAESFVVHPVQLRFGS